MYSKSKMGDTNNFFFTAISYAILTNNVINMKGKMDVSIAITIIQFLSTLLQYLHKSNPTPQQKLVCNFYQKSDILVSFLLVPVCRGGNL